MYAKKENCMKTLSLSNSVDYPKYI